MPSVYFDTSFFMGLIENQQGRRDEAKKIIQFEEKDKNATFHTSVLTVDEFLVGIYNKYAESEDCEDKVSATVRQIQQIASLYGMTEQIARKAAKIESVWGRAYGQIPEADRDPRLRKRRWDAIHLATADHIEATRVYAWDDPWKDVPESVFESLTSDSIISPARCRQPELLPPNPHRDSNGPELPSERPPGDAPETAS